MDEGCLWITNQIEVKRGRESFNFELSIGVKIVIFVVPGASIFFNKPRMIEKWSLLVLQKTSQLFHYFPTKIPKIKIQKFPHDLQTFRPPTITPLITKKKTTITIKGKKLQYFSVFYLLVFLIKEAHRRTVSNIIMSFSILERIFSCSFHLQIK